MGAFSRGKCCFQKRVMAATAEVGSFSGAEAVSYNTDDCVQVFKTSQNG